MLAAQTRACGRVFSVLLDSHAPRPPSCVNMYNLLPHFRHLRPYTIFTYSPYEHIARLLCPERSTVPCIPYALVSFCSLCVYAAQQPVCDVCFVEHSDAATCLGASDS